MMKLFSKDLSNIYVASCNVGTNDLPDMYSYSYTRNSRAAGPKAECPDFFWMLSTLVNNNLTILTSPVIV